MSQVLGLRASLCIQLPLAFDYGSFKGSNKLGNSMSKLTLHLPVVRLFLDLRVFLPLVHTVYKSFAEPFEY